MASLQIRLWKNMDSLLRECETEEEYGEAYRAQSRENHDPAFFGQVKLPKRWGNGTRGPRHDRQSINANDMIIKKLTHSL